MVPVLDLVRVGDLVEERVRVFVRLGDGAAGLVLVPEPVGVPVAVPERVGVAELVFVDAGLRLRVLRVEVEVGVGDGDRTRLTSYTSAERCA